MESKFLAKQVWEFIFPIVKENQILQDVSGVDNFLLLRLWNIVRPIFINDKDLVKELQNAPYDVELHEAFRHLLKKAFEYNPELAKEVTKILYELAEQAKNSNNIVINSKNVVSGSNIRVGGDFRIGDSNNISTSDFDFFIKSVSKKNNKN